MSDPDNLTEDDFAALAGSVPSLADSEALASWTSREWGPDDPCCGDPADCQENCKLDPEWAGNFE